MNFNGEISGSDLEGVVDPEFGRLNLDEFMMSRAGVCHSQWVEWPVPA